MSQSSTRFFSRRWPLFAVALVMLVLAGCGDDGRQSYATETDEPYYRQAEQMKRANRQQEALSAYLKVIEKRGDDAPESHLEAGLVYLHHIRDPIAAIYHFRKYLALRPNSAQAPLVRQRIDAAIREFARTLPAQPLETQLQRVDLMAALDKMKLENDILKQQVADLQAGRGITAGADEEGADSTSPAAVAVARTPAAAPKSGDFSINLDSMPTVRTRPARNEPAPAKATPPPSSAARQSAPASTKQSAPAGAAATPRANGRSHVVQPGDTLSKLSQKYYGTRARWKDILQANRATMKSENDLHVGQQLVIP